MGEKQRHQLSTVTVVLDRVTSFIVLVSDQPHARLPNRQKYLAVRRGTNCTHIRQTHIIPC